jgi:hypothetical protein
MPFQRVESSVYHDQMSMLVFLPDFPVVPVVPPVVPVVPPVVFFDDELPQAASSSAEPETAPARRKVRRLTVPVSFVSPPETVSGSADKVVPTGSWLCGPLSGISVLSLIIQNPSYRHTFDLWYTTMD